MSLQDGKNAEQTARCYLQKVGLTLLEQNYHSRYGEIDLIMRDKQDIVFVEVRSRSQGCYGNALESITQSKMNKLIKTALHYLQKKTWLHKVNSRFDIVTIDIAGKESRMEWIRNAFEVEHYH